MNFRIGHSLTSVDLGVEKGLINVMAEKDEGFRIDAKRLSVAC